MDTTSASLLERLRQPVDEQAWVRFVDLYTPLLYYWARGVGLADHQAADLVQDVLTVLVKKLPQFRYDDQKTFRGWLRVLTLNKWRENQRRQARAPREADAAALAQVSDPGAADPFEEAEYRHYLVARALKLMEAEFQPVTCRACWEYVVAGRPAAEVAAELGISRGAVYCAKSRVLRRLREELQGLLD